MKIAETKPKLWKLCVLSTLADAATTAYAAECMTMESEYEGKA